MITSLDKLIKLLSQLPGLGPRSARRIALKLIQRKSDIMQPLAEVMASVAKEVKECEVCKNLDINSPCEICTNQKRNQGLLCVVEDVSDLWALERGGDYKGVYHILGGNLSALNGRTPNTLSFDLLKRRVAAGGIQEVIIATNATLEGQTTAHYICDMLAPYKVKATRLAHGIPMGAELDYMDEGTISLALKMRREFE
jgi:recombination protein RecR